jgi:HAD superfamily hydrolase (TIGR01509 family)
MIQGVLFDLDGTLADTERIHWRAYREILRGFGTDVDLETYRRHFIVTHGGPEWACATLGLPIDPDELRRRKAVVYRDLIALGVQPLPGALESLAGLRGHQRLAIATNSLRDEASLIVGHLDAAQYLDAVIAREDYVRAKPAPDAYLAAARTLGLEPAACVVVEDTPRGLAAGRAAGMAVVAVPSDLTADADFTGATRRLAGLSELTPALLAGLVAR